MHNPLVQHLIYTLAPTAYCMMRKRRTYTVLWSWQHVEAFNATFLPNGSDKRQQSGRIKAVAVGLSLGGVLVCGSLKSEEKEKEQKHSRGAIKTCG